MNNVCRWNLLLGHYLQSLKRMTSFLFLQKYQGQILRIDRFSIREKVEYREYSSTAWAILAAYGISMPESDEEDEDEEEERPNQKTGQ